MSARAELTVLQQNLDSLRSCIADLRRRYGDVPAVRRLVGDLERFELDSAELTQLPMPTDAQSPAVQYQLIDDRPHDRDMWADADDEGLGGYLRPAR